MGDSAAFLSAPDTKSDPAARHASKTDASTARRVATGSVPSGRGHLPPSRVPVDPSAANSGLRAPVSSPLRAFDFSQVPVRAPSEPSVGRSLDRPGEGPVLPGILGDGRVHPRIESEIDAARSSGGRSLERSTRERLEPGFGDSLGDVRVHTDARAAALTRDVSARAFTVGSDLFFAPGAYCPGSGAGDALIAHEAAHVVQQRGTSAHGALTVSRPGDALEVEAGTMAGAVLTDASPVFGVVPTGRGAVTRRPAGSGRRLARALPSGGETPASAVLVSSAAQEAATPLLSSMNIDAAMAASFYRGEIVAGQIATQGKTGITVFFQLKEGRLRAGIFHISLRGNPSAALRAFSSFRGTAQRLARALEVPEMELMGAAVINKDIEAMLERQGFAKSAEPIPESLGANPGEQIEVYSKRFPVKSAAPITGETSHLPPVKAPAGPGEVGGGGGTAAPTETPGPGAAEPIVAAPEPPAPITGETSLLPPVKAPAGPGEVGGGGGTAAPTETPGPGAAEPIVAAPEPPALDIPLAGAEAGISGAALRGIAGAALRGIVNFAIGIAVGIFVEWGLAKLIQIQFKADLTESLKEQLPQKLSQLGPKLDALRGSKKLFIRVTYDYYYSRASDPIIGGPPFYELGRIKVINVHPGNEELDFGPTREEYPERIFPGRERVRVRASYSVLLDDPAKRAP